ncbi:hypothetical protein AOQ84DRAFT_221314 [Glonium stellatum]|uniref:B30.2/SPRY domain-containing protein n=1 Tax=Glonium stellatum TaxID=574774 RepID=A0A8E2FD53_9PEZI|nr:hypothetical protein AOQ84DRAFT_221314 [Glonium stellatum]
MPRFKNESPPGATSWAYHGEDGGLYFYNASDNAPVNCSPPGMYGLGDTIGVAADFLQKKIFFTKNGERLMNYAFDKVGGRLHPVLGSADSARITANFGIDLNSKPFKWGLGNTLDFDADMPMPKLKRTKTNAL